MWRESALSRHSFATAEPRSVISACRSTGHVVRDSSWRLTTCSRLDDAGTDRHDWNLAPLGIA